MYKRWRRYGSSFDLGRMTLRELFVAYVSRPAIHCYLVLASASLVLAVYKVDGVIGPSSAVLATAIAYPTVWHCLHRFVLHSHFLYKSRLSAPLWKRIHFDHHQDPHRMDVLFGSPLNTAPTILAATLPLGWLAGGGLAGAAAAAGAGFLITCGYEFCHCVQHFNFKPRNRVLRRMKELHLAHHFHDEEGNFGITSFVIDRAFGTFYGSARERPRSRHAFNLGHDADEADRCPWIAAWSGGLPRDRLAPAGTRSGRHS